MKVAQLKFLQVSFTRETQDMHPALIALVHGFNREHDNVLGLDYPGWAPGTTEPTSLAIRIFGVEKDLLLFCEQHKAKRLAALCGFSLQTKSVPDSAGFAAVTRDNRADRVKPAYARRLAARAAARGEQATVTISRDDRVCSATISLSSMSTKQNFLLKMRKVALDAVSDVTFNSYGLCKQGGLPQF